ncbi:hypothetical protein Rt10032_c02g0778 [Rhodotorula toruloides]|uniref:Uncharacterized protein n=1 Tax=Rhodotorula toruloides TaxID=5286 RepID=A0A511K8T9_RHOTO|nr:hypothetical protein Rt10032_c02g0778 [Rhodotorula toruloides]
MSQSNRNQNLSSSDQQGGRRRPLYQELRDAWHDAAATAHKVMTRRDSSGFEDEQNCAAAEYLVNPRDAPKPGEKKGESSGSRGKGSSSPHSLTKQMEHDERYGSGRRARIYGFAVAADDRRP